MEYFFEDVPNEKGIAQNVASPHAPGVAQEAVEPLQGVALKEERGPLDGSCIEIENGSNGSYVTMNVQLVPVLVSPFLLLGCRHTNPEQVGIGGVDEADHCLTVLVGELSLVGWGIGDYAQMGIVVGCPLPNEAKNVLRTAQKQAHTLLLTLGKSIVDTLHLIDKQIPSGHSLFGLRLCLEPTACHHDAASVGQKIVALTQCLGKQGIVLGCVERVGIEGVDKCLSFGNGCQRIARREDVECGEKQGGASLNDK